MLYKLFKMWIKKCTEYPTSADAPTKEQLESLQLELNKVLRKMENNFDQH